MATTLYGIKNCELFLLEEPQKKPKRYLSLEGRRWVMSPP